MLLGVAGALLLATGSPASAASGERSPDLRVDFRYAVPWWQTPICLPDDAEKTLVGKEGELLYQYPVKPDNEVLNDFPRPFPGFQARISVDMDEGSQWTSQELASPAVPIVRTIRRHVPVEMIQEAFAMTPANDSPTAGRCDVMLVRLQNAGDQPTTVKPVITIESPSPMTMMERAQQVKIGDATRVVFSRSIAEAKAGGGKRILQMESVLLPAREEQSLAVSITRGKDPRPGPTNLKDIEMLRARAACYWSNGRIPYDRIQVGDPGIQALLDSSIRNIYQAREIKRGLPAFQVGPTVYRLFAIADSAFILEATTYFGRSDEARDGVRYLLSLQRKDGGFSGFPNHWSEAGYVLWAVTRQARLTGDKHWLGQQWPQLERAVAFIMRLRRQASADPRALYYRLIPPGFADGGLRDVLPEYTNVYWSLLGMRAASDAAQWLGKTQQADQWRREYDDFYAAFRQAAQRDMRRDAHGNLYLPIVMGSKSNELPQRAQWAFCHTVFPGKLFSSDDPLVRGNMAMLQSVECEGAVLGTGWLADGIWAYFASYYAHAWLWLGDGQKAAEILYAFANHAAPTLVWREEQMPRGKGDQVIGDIPHNWASAEFIRLVRHLLVLERGNDLHLLEGMPAVWARPGAVTRLQGMPTEFGPMSFELRVSSDGHTARLRVDPPSRVRPEHIYLHWAPWAKPDQQRATVELPVTGTKCGIFRKRFTMPADWQGTGRTWLWIRGASPGTPTLPPHKWRVFLDGQPVTGGEHGYCNEDLTGRLTPGEHTLAVATETLSVVVGVVGNVWLEHIPEPVARQSLAGDWNGMQLPGTARIPFDQVKREFTLDPAMKGKRALLYIETTENIIPGIFLNGRLMNRDFAGMHSLVDVTPYVRWDRPSRITLNSMYPQHPTAVKTVEIRYYEPGAY